MKCVMQCTEKTSQCKPTHFFFLEEMMHSLLSHHIFFKNITGLISKGVSERERHSGTNLLCQVIKLVSRSISGISAFGILVDEQSLDDTSESSFDCTVTEQSSKLGFERLVKLNTTDRVEGAVGNGGRRGRGS